jgi:hypothetical protein
LLNQFCVSSCDGFVYAVKEQLGEKVRLIGQPQAADTAYSRLTINVSLNAEDQRGYTLKVVPIRQESSKKAFIAQTVSVTRSVDAEGRIQSGVPLPLDLFVPLTFENTSTWVRSALSAALQD